jgi:O-antigen/teichoic acid export membrane protein
LAVTSTVPQPKPRQMYSVKKLIRGSSSRVLRMFILASIGFFLMPFMVHRLGSQQYGIWATAVAFLGYYSFLDLGLSGAIFTHMSYALGREDHEEARNIYSVSALIFSGVGIVLILATFILAFALIKLHYTHGRAMATIILILGISTATSFGMRVPFGTLNAAQHFDITAWVLVMTGVIRATGTVYLLTHHHGIVALAWLAVFGGVPANAIVLWSVNHYFPYLKIFRFPRWNQQTFRKLYRFAGPVMLGQVADRIRFQTDTLTVSFFVGLMAVTHYTVGSTLVMYYLDAIAAIVGVFMPVLSMQKSVDDDVAFEKSFLAGSRVALCASAFICFGLIVWSKDFITRWMGAKFTDAYPVVVILAIAVFLETSQSTSVNALYASLHQKAYAVLNISEAVCNLVLSILFVRPFGMMGVAMGTLIPSIVFRGILQPIVVERLLHISKRKTLGLYAKTGSRCALLLIVPFVISYYWLAPDILHLVLIPAICAVLYIVPVWLLEFGGKGSDRILARLRGARAA